MDIESFYQLTIPEFEAVYKKWSDLRDSEFRNTWEQTRNISYWSIKAYLGRMPIRRFMPFKWDGKKIKAAGTEKVHDTERFERLKKEYGDTTI